MARAAPLATFREIENEVDKRLALLRVRMLSDAAMRSAQAEWEGANREVVCSSCGAQLEQKGKRSVSCKRVEARVELEREYGVCPRCGQGIFPPG